MKSIQESENGCDNYVSSNSELDYTTLTADACSYNWYRIKCGDGDTITHDDNYPIPEGIRKIEAGAFHESDELWEVYIPSSVTEVEATAFDKCVNLKKIHADSQYYKSIDGVLYTADLSVLVCCPAAIEGAVFNVPNSVTKIMAGAFAYCKFQTINIPNSVTEIGNHAFFECNEIEHLHLPNSVKKIGFAPIVSGLLIDIQIDNDCYKTFQGALYTADFSKLIVYPAESKSTEFVLPKQTTHIGQHAVFHSIYKEIRLPQSVTHIDTEAFTNCHSLTDLHLTDSIEHIGEDPFCFSFRLKNIYIPKGTLPHFTQFEEFRCLTTEKQNTEHLTPEELFALPYIPEYNFIEE